MATKEVPEILFSSTTVTAGTFIIAPAAANFPPMIDIIPEELKKPNSFWKKLIATAMGIGQLLQKQSEALNQLQMLQKKWQDAFSKQVEMGNPDDSFPLDKTKQDMTEQQALSTKMLDALQKILDQFNLVMSNIAKASSDFSSHLHSGLSQLGATITPEQAEKETFDLQKLLLEEINLPQLPKPSDQKARAKEINDSVGNTILRLLETIPANNQAKAKETIFKQVEEFRQTLTVQNGLLAEAIQKAQEFKASNPTVDKNLDPFISATASKLNDYIEKATHAIAARRYEAGETPAPSLQDR